MGKPQRILRRPSVRLWALSAALPSLLLIPPAFSQQSVWTDVDRIVAVGDVHGDIDQFIKVLRAAEVIDKDNQWIAGKAHLVQTGDVVDKGPDSRKAMDLLMDLEKQADKAGGKVHVLIGNHEAMVVRGECRYSDPGEAKAFGGENAYRKAMAPNGKYGRWIVSHNAVIEIDGLLFVHGGLRAVCLPKSLDDINKAIREQLAKGTSDGVEMSLKGPLWDRFFVLGDEDKAAKELAVVLKAYKATRMIVGHTGAMEGVRPSFDDRLIQIDVGMTAMYDGPAACLVVEKGEFYEARHGKEKRKLELKAAASQPATKEANNDQPTAKRAGVQFMSSLADQDNLRRAAATLSLSASTCP